MEGFWVVWQFELGNSLASTVYRSSNTEGNDYTKSNKSFCHQCDFVVSANSVFFQNLLSL